MVARLALPCERVLSSGSCDRFGRCGNHMSEGTIIDILCLKVLDGSQLITYSIRLDIKGSSIDLLPFHACNVTCNTMHWSEQTASAIEVPICLIVQDGCKFTACADVFPLWPVAMSTISRFLWVGRRGLGHGLKAPLIC